MRFLLLAPLFFSELLMAQGLLFKEIYSPSEKAVFQAKHAWESSSWQSPYGRLSKTDFNLTSQKLSCSKEDSCRYKIFAGHELQNFEKTLGFGNTLENPQISGVLSFQGQRRIVSEIGINSPSDKPFNSFRDTNISATAASVPSGDLRRQKKYWMYFLSYSNTRSFLPNIPLPGAGYTINTGSGWVYYLGVPFLSVSYFNYPHVSFRFLGGPYFYSAELFRGPPVFQYGFSANWKQDSYMIAKRVEEKERFFLDQKDISFSFKHPLSKSTLLEWKASYYFHQEIKHGKSYTDLTQPTEDLGTSVAFSLYFKHTLDSNAN